MTQVTNNIDDIVEKISNLNIDDETGKIKPILDIVQDVPNAVEIRRSGRVINKPLRLTYEVQSKSKKDKIKDRIKNKIKHTMGTMGTIPKKKAPQEKTKDIIVNTNDNKEIIIVLDVTSGCNLYNKRSSSSSSDEIKQWKIDMKLKIEKIMNIKIKENRYNKLIDYRNNLSNNCNFWMTKKMLEEYSNILQENINWIKHQQEIVDLYKKKHNVELRDDQIIKELTGDNLKQQLTNEFKNQLTNELNSKVQKLEQLEAVRDRSGDNSKAKSRSRSRSRSTSDHKYEPERGGLYRKTKKNTKKYTKKYTKKNKKEQKRTKKVQKSANY